MSRPSTPSRERIVRALLAAQADADGGGGCGSDSGGGGSGGGIDGAGRAGRGLSDPLRAACRAAGAIGAVEALLEGGADADASPPPGGGGGGGGGGLGGEGREEGAETARLLRPLHIAAVHGNADTVGALTLRGCHLDAKTLDPSRCGARACAWASAGVKWCVIVLCCGVVWRNPPPVVRGWLRWLVLVPLRS